MNPRAHTAVVLLADEQRAMVDAYLSIFEDHTMRRCVNEGPVTPSVSISYYWVGHDIVTSVLLPFLFGFISMKHWARLPTQWLEFLRHLLYWKEGTYEVWDPWPFWWLYCAYWPGMFLSAILSRNWWSRCNVSTTKIFKC